MARISTTNTDFSYIEPFYCPNCGRTTNPTLANFSEQLDGLKPGFIHEYDNINKQSDRYLSSSNGLPMVMLHELTICATPGCDGMQLRIALAEKAPARETHGDPGPGGRNLIEWSRWKVLYDEELLPKVRIRDWPSYVPTQVVEDFSEAHGILNISPKASATLSRRCLQFMLRDFWKVRPNTLYVEIMAIQDKISDELFGALSSIRSIGNRGAHPEKDAATIVPVDQHEAKLLLEVVEIAIEDWYITKHDREERLKRAAALRSNNQEKN